MAITCPNDAALTAFQRGELAETILDEIAEHLETCSSCDTRMRALDDVADHVVSALRSSQSIASTIDFIRGSTNGRSNGTEVPKHIGPYQILGILGRGGMGVVYKARHEKLQRVVAMKMLRSGRFSNPEERIRFERETSALARLQHPNIVQIFETGECEGQPYFTLELVEGGTLSQQLTGKPWPPVKAAACVETLARAVHHAHQNGIVHRDLKPANVLLSVVNDKSHGFDLTTVKIADFGVARLLEHSDRKTQTGLILGTPEYMAPEQTEGSVPVGPAADVYALGTILYEVLTGRPPFRADTPMGTIRQVQTLEPIRVTRLQPGVPRDLETICLKCLEKEPAKRYASAQDLAHDCAAFLRGEPIRARPVTAPERLVKWVRRRPSLAAALAALTLVTAVGIILVFWQWGRAEAKATSEATARREVEKGSARLTIERGLNLCDQGDFGPGLASLVEGCALASSAQDADLERVARINLSAWRQPFNRERYLCQHNGWVNFACFNRAHTILLTASEDRSVRRWDAATGRPLGEPLIHEFTVDHAVFSPDETLILTGSGSDDGRIGAACVWDTDTGKLLTRLSHPGTVSWVAFMPDGRTFVTLCEKQMRLWDTAGRSTRGEVMTHGEALIQVACLSQDGRTILTGGTDKAARLWDAATGKPQGTPLIHADAISVVAFCPDGRSIVTGDKGRVAQFWDRETGAKIGAEMLHNGLVKSVAFSRDGQYLATGSVVNSDPVGDVWRRKTGEARLWRARTGAVWDAQAAGKPLSPPRPYLFPVWSLAFSPDGNRLLTGTGDGSVVLLETTSGQQIGNILAAGGTAKVVEFSEDGRTAMTATAGTTARLWDLAAEPLAAPPLFQDIKAPKVAMHPHQPILAVGDADGVVRLWDLTQRKVIGPTLLHGKAIRCLVWSPTGDTLVTVGLEAGPIKFWNPISGECVRTWSPSGTVRVFTYLDGGETILLSYQNAPIQLWNAADLTIKSTLSNDTTDANQVASRNGSQTVMTTHYGRPARQWDLNTGRLLRTFPRYEWDFSCAISPDGKTLLTGSAYGRTAQLWDIATGDRKGRPLPHSRSGQGALTFSPDGRVVATGGDDHTVRLWDLATGQPLGPPRQLGSSAEMVAFTPDGRLIVGAGPNGARVWEVPMPADGSVEDIRAAIDQLTGSTTINR